MEARGASGLAFILAQARVADAEQRKARRAAEAFVGPVTKMSAWQASGMDVHAAEGGDGVDDQVGAMLGDERADLVDRD